MQHTHHCLLILLLHSPHTHTHPPCCAITQDGDGEIDYNELARMILCDDIMERLALVPDRSLKSKAQAAANAPLVAAAALPMSCRTPRRRSRRS